MGLFFLLLLESIKVKEDILEPKLALYLKLHFKLLKLDIQIVKIRYVDLYLFKSKITIFIHSIN